MKIFLSVLLLSASSLYAQVKPQYAYSVYLNYPDRSIKATVLNSTKTFEAKGDLTYYWYTSNKIMETQGGYDGKILNGAYTCFYLSGNLKEQGAFNKGLKDGKWMKWYENGKIQEITHWTKGVIKGIRKLFNTNGELIKEEKYKHGKLHGYQLMYENGKGIEKRNYKNGVEIKAPVKDTTIATNKEKVKEVNSKATKKNKRKVRSAETKMPVKDIGITANKEKNKEVDIKKVKKNKRKTPKPVEKFTKEKHSEANDKISFIEKIKKRFKKKKNTPPTEKTKSETK